MLDTAESKDCEFVVLYTSLLEVERESSRFCKMACRSKAVGPCWYRTRYSSQARNQGGAGGKSPI